MQNVGEHQLLMLLLVMKAKFDKRRDVTDSRGRRVGQQTQYARLDMGAIARHFRGVRPRHQPAVRARMTRTGADVIGIEQKCEVRIIYAIGGNVRRQNELLEEPRRVGAMPLDRTGVRHRLDDLILGRQRRSTPLGLSAHNSKDV